MKASAVRCCEGGCVSVQQYRVRDTAALICVEARAQRQSPGSPLSTALISLSPSTLS